MYGGGGGSQKILKFVTSKGMVPLDTHFKIDSRVEFFKVILCFQDPLEMDSMLPKKCTAMSLAMSGVVLTLENNQVCVQSKKNVF